MNKKFTAIFSAGAIVVFLFAAAYFIISICNEVSAGKQRASGVFSSFIQSVSATTGETAYSDDIIYKNVMQYLLTHPDIAAATVSSRDGRHSSFPQFSRYFTMDEQNRQIISVNSPMIKVFSQSAAGSHSSYLVTAAVYIMKPDTVFKYGRISFLIILAATLCVLFLIFYSHIQTNSLNENSFLISSKKTSPENDDFSLDNVEEIKIEKSELESENFNHLESCLDDAEISVSDAPSASAEQFQSEEIVQEPAISKINDPLGLFSEQTGFGWEQYLEPRLDAELSRAVSSEQDLSFVIIRFCGLSRQSLAVQKSIPAILSYFKFRDLVFEYGEDSFAGIMINTDLDTAMTAAENVYAGISAVFNELSITPCAALGLTTRTLRIVPASRMISEAVQAAEKASHETEMPIVAFRANPDKYRQFIAGETV